MTIRRFKNSKRESITNIIKSQVHCTTQTDLGKR